MAAGPQEWLAALTARSCQRTSPAPLAGAGAREELLRFLELRGRALLEQHQALGSANGFVCTALGLGGLRNAWGELEAESTLGVQQQGASFPGGRYRIAAR